MLPRLRILLQPLNYKSKGSASSITIIIHTYLPITLILPCLLLSLLCSSQIRSLARSKMCITHDLLFGLLTTISNWACYVVNHPRLLSFSEYLELFADVCDPILYQHVLMSPTNESQFPISLSIL